MELLKNIVFVCLFIKIIDAVAVRMVRAWKYMKLRKKHHKRMEEIKERNRIKETIAEIRRAEKAEARLYRNRIRYDEGIVIYDAKF